MSSSSIDTTNPVELLDSHPIRKLLTRLGNYVEIVDCLVN